MVPVIFRVPCSTVVPPFQEPVPQSVQMPVPVFDIGGGGAGVLFADVSREGRVGVLAADAVGERPPAGGTAAENGKRRDRRARRPRWWCPRPPARVPV